MTCKAIIHFGLPKTATTMTQNALFSQKDALLAESGLLYPGDEANHTNQLCTAFLADPRNHITNKLAGTPLEELQRRAVQIRRHLADEVRRIGPQRVLFSAEGLVNLSAEELTGLRGWMEGFCDAIEILCVVREPISYVTSVTQQHLKGGETLAANYANLPLPYFKRRLHNAQSVFGADSITVMPFEAMVAAEGGMIRSFLRAVGVEGPVAEAVEGAATFDNASLTHGAALMLSRLNETRPMITPDGRGNLRSELELEVLSQLKGEKFRLPPDVAKRVFESSRGDVEWLNEQFGLDLYREEPTFKEEVSLGEDAQFMGTLSAMLSNLINYRHVKELEAQLSRIPDTAPDTARKGLRDKIARLRGLKAPRREPA